MNSETHRPLTTEEEARLRVIATGEPFDGIEDYRRLLATIDVARLAAREGRDVVVAALTSEDEIAHGEAVREDSDGYVRLGICAYCDDDWPCRTQRAIDKLLAALQPASEDPG